MSTRSDALALPRQKRREVVQAGGMGMGETIATAMEAIGANKLRSLLTALGIIIGVGAVIIMISIGNGASASVSQRLQGLGTNLVTVTPGGQRGPGFVSAGAGSQQTLTEADATAISNGVEGVAAISPSLSGGVQAVSGGSNWSTRAQGVYPGYQQIENWQLAAGSLLTDQDEQSGSRVAVIGQTPLVNLFGNGNPGSADPASAIGQTIRIKNVPFTVEGVLASKSDQEDDVILVPFTTAKERLFPQTYVNQIVVQVQSQQQMTTAQSEITDLLRERHHLTGSQNDFSVRNLNSIVQTAQGVTQTMTLLLSGVAAVSLLVGGIGIMNIMLVSVTERTREIGIRSAIGANPGDILRQFLFEALALTGAGGLIGILMGIGGSMAISLIAGWSTLIAPQAIFLAFGFAAAVGIFFGYYPARKASQLDPIQALRYE